MVGKSTQGRLGNLHRRRRGVVLRIALSSVGRVTRVAREGAGCQLTKSRTCRTECGRYEAPNPLDLRESDLRAILEIKLGWHL
jgi:hypothetical protein